jgi:hypothetical protein
MTSQDNYNKYEPSLGSTNEHMDLKEYIYQRFFVLLEELLLTWTQKSTI